MSISTLTATTLEHRFLAAGTYLIRLLAYDDTAGFTLTLDTTAHRCGDG